MILKSHHPYTAYAASLLVVVLCTIAALLLRHLFEPENLVMMYLVGVVFIGSRYGRAPSIVASILSVGAFNFFLTKPYYSFHVYEEKYYITFAFLIAASLIASSVAVKLRLKTAEVARQNKELQALYQTASALASCRGHQMIASTAIRHIESTLPAQINLWLPNGDHGLQSIKQEGEYDAALWAYQHHEACGKHTQTMPAMEYHYIPLITQEHALGVLSLQWNTNDFVQCQALISAYASLIASALERASASKAAEMQSLETERATLRNTLLCAIGHDLRTPLASMSGAATTLASQKELSPQAMQLANSIYQETTRLNRLVHNLLDISRMGSGALKLNRQPYFINELIGSALQHTQSTAGHGIHLQIEKDLPLLNLDGVLIEQILVNLIENAMRYTPESGAIEIAAIQTPYAIETSVSDAGVGIAENNEITIFERYKRLDTAKPDGMGLGLAICKAIVEAHGGNIWARNKPQGGAIFTFTLPFQFNRTTITHEAA